MDARDLRATLRLSQAAIAEEYNTDTGEFISQSNVSKIESGHYGPGCEMCDRYMRWLRQKVQGAQWYRKKKRASIFVGTEEFASARQMKEEMGLTWEDVLERWQMYEQRSDYW